jgi:hypothetical protein
MSMEFGYRAGILDGLKMAEELATQGRSLPEFIAEMRAQVAAEERAAKEQRAAEHRAEGHELEFRLDDVARCAGCNLTGDELLISDGWKRTEKGWSKS